MSQPTFVQKVGVKSSSATTQTITIATTLGNTIILPVIITQTSPKQQVANIVDSAGNNAVGVPINKWTLLGANVQNGTRIEVWACKGAAVVSSITVNLASGGGAAAFMAVAVEESTCNGISSPQFQAVLPAQNPYVGQYIHEKVCVFPNSAAEKLFAIFVLPGDGLTSTQDFNSTPMDGTVRAHDQLTTTPSLAYQIIEQGTVDSGTVNPGTPFSSTADDGLLCADAINAAVFATAAHVAASRMVCIYFVISGGLILNTQPGFSDQPDTGLAAEKVSLGVQLAKISNNAMFGMVRSEFFQGVYKNGDTVDLPVSPADGYAYTREELTYIWAVYSSANPANGWITGPAALWYCGWKVDQDTGAVISEEWYRSDGASSVSNDGFLQVFTIGQRQQASLTIAAQPTFAEINSSAYYQDRALDTDLLVNLNNNAKWTAVKNEVIYMGEFYQGKTVGQPVSPADGYKYEYSEVAFTHSWRWTCGQASYQAPAWGTDWSFDGMHADISSTGAVTCEIVWGGRGGEGSSVDNTSGRIAVFAICSRQPRWTVYANSRTWDNVGGKNVSSFVLPYGSMSGPNAYALNTQLMQDVFGGVDPRPLYPTTRIPVTAGQVYVLKYAGGKIPSYAGTPDYDPLGGSSGFGTISCCGQYVSSSQKELCCVGCYTDDAGNIVGSPFFTGNTSISLTIPIGATHIQLGVNDFGPDGTEPQYYVGGWQFTINRYVPELANQFAEVSSSVFYPGNLLPASAVLQIHKNIQEASLSPEIFGPTDYAVGTTIPTPTSPLDGYAYSRSELTYIWDWKYATVGAAWPPGNNNMRTAQFTCNVNESTGVVTMDFWRLAPGGPYYHYTSGFAAKITVTVVAVRSKQQTPITAPVTNNAPSDAGSQGDGTPPGWTVNGV